MEMDIGLLPDGPSKFTAGRDRANVRQAVARLVEASLAVLDCDVEPLPFSICSREKSSCLSCRRIRSAGIFSPKCLRSKSHGLVAAWTETQSMRWNINTQPNARNRKASNSGHNTCRLQDLDEPFAFAIATEG